MGNTFMAGLQRPAILNEEKGGGGGGGSAEMDAFIARTLIGQEYSGMSNIYVNSTASYVGEYAFAKTSGAVGIVLQNASEVGNSAFAYCSVNAIILPEATTVGVGAFQYAPNLVYLDIPKLQTAGASAFTGTKISMASFPDLESASGAAFMNITTLEYASLPKLAVVNQNAFANCSALETVNVEGATDIGSSAFAKCSNLTDVNADSAQIIRRAAFSSCSALNEITLPSVSDIWTEAFWACTNLRALYLPNESVVCKLSASEAFNQTPMKSSTYTGSFGSIYVPSALYESYITASVWSMFSARIASIT